MINQQECDLQAPLNRLWAKLILEELARLGVEHVCLAPGSRSTPLTLAAEENNKLMIHHHFDERGLGFFALGLAKTTQEPVAIIVTSGTAVANLLPAVCESALTKEKLVLLTSDRPPELIGCGANQAIHQLGIFSQHVCSAVNLPVPHLSITPNWLLTSVDQAYQVQRQQGGSIHINCPYPEPLYGGDADFSSYLQSVSSWSEQSVPYLNISLPSEGSLLLSNEEWAALTMKKGMIVVGNVKSGELLAIKAFAKQLGWPILVDPQAGGSSEWAHFDLWLQNPACYEHLSQSDVLIQFGSRLVSKRLGQFIAAQQWQFYGLIDEHLGQLDPHHHSLHRFLLSSQQWLTAYSINGLGCTGCWADSLKYERLSIKSLLSFDENPEALTELRFAAQLNECLTIESALFLGNSLIVRLVDMVSDLRPVPVYTNRGASGIDGLIATAAGVQQGLQKPLLCVLGDTSLLYDLNSLALLANVEHPLVIVVLNNDGGGIFDMLPVPDAKKEQLYRMPHGFEFSHAAAMFGLDYLKPEKMSDAIEGICVGLASAKKPLLVEIQTPAGEAGRDLKSLFEEVKNATLL